MVLDVIAVSKIANRRQTPKVVGQVERSETASDALSHASPVQFAPSTLRNS